MRVQCKTCKREFAGERHCKGHLFGWNITECLLGQTKYSHPGLNARTNEEMRTATRLPAPEGKVCEPMARNDNEVPEQPGCDGAMAMEEAWFEDAMEEAWFEDAMEEPGFEDAMEEPGFEDAMEKLGFDDPEEGEDEGDLEAGEEGEGERSILEEFQMYVEHAKKNHLELTWPFVAGVKFMKLLANKGCALQ
jgi:hypothetical protein